MLQPLFSEITKNLLNFTVILKIYLQVRKIKTKN